MSNGMVVGRYGVHPGGMQACDIRVMSMVFSIAGAGGSRGAAWGYTGARHVQVHFSVQCTVYMGGYGRGWSWVVREYAGMQCLRNVDDVQYCRGRKGCMGVGHTWAR